LSILLNDVCIGMKLRLCACQWRTGVFGYYSAIPFYFIETLAHTTIRGVSADLRLNTMAYVNLSFVCVSYGSLYLSSSLALLSLCGLLLLVSTFIIPTSELKAKSCLLHAHKTDIFGNAYIFSCLLAAGIMQALNLTYLIHNVCGNMRSNMCAVACLAIILKGRLGSHMKTKMKALCLGSKLATYSLSRILDYGCVSCISTLGSIGIKTVFSRSF
jgi:hypothetical protein